MPVRLLCTVLMVVVACTGGDAEPQAGDATGGQDGQPAALVARPKAELEGRCRPRPRSEGGAQVLAADLTVRNTGNLTVAVRVVATWPQPRGLFLAKSQRLRLELDESAEVTLRLGVSESEARAVERAVARGRSCYTRVRVTKAFGQPR